MNTLGRPGGLWPIICKVYPIMNLITQYVWISVGVRVRVKVDSILQNIAPLYIHTYNYTIHFIKNLMSMSACMPVSIPIARLSIVHSTPVPVPVRRA